MILKSASILFVVGFMPSITQAVVIESGDFIAEVQRLKGLSFSSGSNLYVAPDAGQRSAFRDLAGSIAGGDMVTADAQAAALNYEVVNFTDTNSSRGFLGLREKLTGGVQTLGWGSYFFDVSASNPLLIEATHPRFDTNSWEIAAKLFRDADAAGFLMAGAHRNANGAGTADVAHLAESIFQEVHEVWSGVGIGLDSIQIHGFNLANHPVMPGDTDAVVSAGDGSVSDAMLAVDAALENVGFVTYGFNTLNVNDPLNEHINGNVPGTDFSGLGGTTNVQGQFTRAIGGEFVHIELAQSIRFDSGNRVLASDALVAATDQVNTVSSPSGLILMLLSLIGFSWCRRRTAIASKSL